MYRKLLLFCVISLTTNILTYVSANEQMFKVPLEVRQHNRPKRLVEDSTDPDMQRLKEIQDQFFTIVGNSSLGKEFKSFNQLLNLIDSNAGKELGKLMINGFMIAYGKDNSNQILTEFLDDFQYRVSPDFADSFVDYVEFIKTIDLKMIPLTIQTLFRKDELGNSLAQIPLGQLVDLVQPEASKYGIDIRSVINGILGKGDSTFPDMIKKLLDNFNMKSLFNNFSKSLKRPNVNKQEKEVEAELNGLSDKEEIRLRQEESKRKFTKDKTLFLFKPLIAKLLKENEIDLEPDAVIQVLTPFVSPLLQNFMGSSSVGTNNVNNNNIDINNNRDSGLSQILPMIALLTSQFGGGKNSNGQKPDLMQGVMSLLSGLGNDNNGQNKMNMIMNLASGFLKANQNKNKKEKPKSAGKSEIDMDVLKKMESTISGNDGSGKFNKDPLSELEHIELGEDKMLAEVLDDFLLRIQADKKLQKKAHDAFALGKSMFRNKYGTFDQVREQLTQVAGPSSRIFMSLIGPFYLSEKELDDFMIKHENIKTRNEIIQKTLPTAKQLLQLISSEDYLKEKGQIVNTKMQEVFAAFGIKGMTLLDLPQKLSPIVKLITKGWDLSVNLEELLEPLQLALFETKIWFIGRLKGFASLSDKEQEKLIVKSFNDDFVEPLLRLWKISKASKTTPSCLPRAICEYVNEISEENYLRLMISRFGSVIYSGVRSDTDDDFLLFVQAARASVFRGECAKYFPHECPKLEETKKEEEEPTDHGHQEL